MTSLPIHLSNDFSPRVSAGDPVKPGDTIATRPLNKEQSIDIAAQLRIPIKQVKKYLKKNPGDRVAPGDIIASRKKLISKDDIVSNTKGTVARFERDTGKIVILLSDSTDEDTAAQTEEQKIVSPIDGVVEICDNDRILLKTDKDVVVGEKGQGQDADGEIFVIAPESLDTSEPVNVALHQLDASCIGKIILGEGFDREVLVKAISIGVLGIIALSIREDDFTYLNERHPDTPVIQIGKDEYDKLAKWAGKKIYMQGNNKSILLLHI